MTENTLVIGSKDKIGTELVTELRKINGESSVGAYDIVKAHGGELKVETKEGEGSELIILLSI